MTSFWDRCEQSFGSSDPPSGGEAPLEDLWLCLRVYRFYGIDLAREAASMRVRHYICWRATEREWSELREQTVLRQGAVVENGGGGLAGPRGRRILELNR